MTPVCMTSRIVCAIAAASITLGSAATVASPTSRTALIVAHRGGAALMPENTLPAFDNAIRIGADWLEFDMVMTSDDKLIIQHDPTVNSTFCKADPASGVTSKPVRMLTLAQLLKFDCGARHRDIYPRQNPVPGTRMPTPNEFFVRFKGANVTFFGEIKMPGPGEGEVDPVRFARLVAATVRKYRVEDRFILQSSDWRAVDAMHVIDPDIKTCLLGVWRGGPDHLATARAHHAGCMLLRLQDADAAEVKRLKAAGITVVSEVIDDPASWRDYLARGDDALFTNDPAGLKRYLDGQKGNR